MPYARRHYAIDYCQPLLMLMLSRDARHYCHAELSLPAAAATLPLPLFIDYAAIYMMMPLFRLSSPSFHADITPCRYAAIDAFAAVAITPYAAVAIIYAITLR